ncbi:MAG: CDP-diacylglycerol--serine O-phosphatidyltransferase [Deltaproteobacteria bacterium]|nr:CDP-diacylglycerol--serine O-phosphatidyltransferase [Deltaproteobacteria bacterium]MBW2136417.1 CDP-diacylglycerol--serine O-phosphatidyltransferase [Deltaproteobacteria bacterium]
MKTKRKKRIKKKRERKGIFILPNLFTSASLFGGFYAIIAAIQGRYEAAAVAVVLSGILDGIDGRIARFTKTSSLFGKEYDSLADLVAFGVAPAVIVFQWALKPFGRLGWLAAFMYVICGALRLARFNVQKNTVEANFFKGLPIPAAACSIASLILFSGIFDNLWVSRPVIILIMIYALSFLMVSTVNYPSFKEFDIRKRKPFNVLVSLILILMVVAYRPKVMLFIIMVSYLVSGPVVTALRLSRRHGEKKAAGEDLGHIKGEGETNGLKDEKVIG